MQKNVLGFFLISWIYISIFLCHHYPYSPSLTLSFPTRCASVHSVGPSGLFLRHPDCPVRLEPLQQKPDRAPSPCGDLRYGRGERQQGQHSPLDCAERLQSQPCPRQVTSYLCASVQCSRYVSLPMSPVGLKARTLSPVNCSCLRFDMPLHPQDRMIVCGESQLHCKYIGRLRWLTVERHHIMTSSLKLWFNNQQRQNHTFHPVLFIYSGTVIFMSSKCMQTGILVVVIIFSIVFFISRAWISVVEMITGVIFSCSQLTSILFVVHRINDALGCWSLQVIDVASANVL